MGKWEAQETTERGEYNVYKETESGLISIGNLDQDEVQILDKDTATRYALALNIVDAGVDLGDAVVFMQEAKAIRDYCEKYHAQPLIEDALYTKLYKEMVHPFLQRIANAVEGDTTKEDI